MEPTFTLQVVIDPKTSKRIFDLAKSQQEELEEEDEEEDEADVKPAAFFKPRSTSDTEEEDDMGGESADELLEEEDYPELVSIGVDGVEIRCLMFLIANRCRRSRDFGHSPAAWSE